MKNLGAVTLGNETNNDFLKGIIPSQWKQIVYENNNYWSIEYQRNDDVDFKNFSEKDAEFDKICDSLINEFGDNIMEIYSIISAGKHFIIYLKKLYFNETFLYL